MHTLQNAFKRAVKKVWMVVSKIIVLVWEDQEPQSIIHLKNYYLNWIKGRPNQGICTFQFDSLQRKENVLSLPYSKGAILKDLQTFARWH